MMTNIGFVIALLLFASASKINGDADIKGRLLTPNEGCGLTKVKNTRIVGGSEAPAGAWPWIALLASKRMVFGKIQLSFFCGGSLITSKHVLTAAHCISEKLYAVRLGEHDVRNTRDGLHQDILVARSERHEHFNPDVKIYDIGIIELELDVEFSDSIRPVCLPLDEPLLSRDFTGYNPFVAGWGNTRNFGELSPILMQLQVPVVDNARCMDLATQSGATFAKYQIRDSVICAGIRGGENFWDGDSGGPLMLPVHENGTSFPVYQIGIVSFSYGFAQENLPGVYTKVAYFADWIKKHIQSSTH